MPEPNGIARLAHVLLRKRSSHLMVEIFRSFVVSGVSFIFDFGLLYVLTDVLGLFYLVSATISYSAGLIVSYFLSVKWAFARRAVDNRAVEFGVFVAIGVAGMGINALILWIWTGLLGLHYMLGRIVSAIIGYIWKFVARKLALFR